MSREILRQRLSKLTKAELLDRLLTHLLEEEERETKEQQAFDVANHPENVERFGKLLNRELGSKSGGIKKNLSHRDKEKRAYKAYVARPPAKHGAKGKFDDEQAEALGVEKRTVARWREAWQNGEKTR